MRETWRRAGWAAALSGAIGAAAHRRGALTTSGAVGALLIGTTVSGAGGWDWGGTLVYFFVSSSALSRLASDRKAGIASDKFDKGSRRDLAQALANGGVASGLALLRATPWGARHAQRLEAAFVGALATATADTWATEVGTLSPSAPRLITTGRSVPPGTSGGVTPLGLGAALVGAGSLGLIFALACGRFLVGTAPTRLASRALVRAALVGGMIGCLLDSLVGAQLQAMYCCPRCGAETERRRHCCGSPTIPLRGLPWLDNDGVNAVSTAIGALAGALVGWR
jgi:uncharacterized protein (TIGR00297 family)